MEEPVQVKRAILSVLPPSGNMEQYIPGRLAAGAHNFSGPLVGGSGYTAREAVWDRRTALRRRMAD